MNMTTGFKWTDEPHAMHGRVHVKAYYVDNIKHGPFSMYIKTIDDNKMTLIKHGYYDNGELHGEVIQPKDAPHATYSVPVIENFWHGIQMGYREKHARRANRSIEHFVVSYYTKWMARNTFVLNLADHPEFTWRSIDDISETDLFTITLMNVFPADAMNALEHAVRNNHRTDIMHGSDVFRSISN